MARTYDDNTLTYDEIILGYDGGLYKEFNDDTATLSEPIFKKGIGRIWSDNATLSEIAQRNIHFFISELLTITDLVSKGMAIERWTETATLSEPIFVKGLGKNWTDTSTIADSTGKDNVKTLSDTYTLSEYMIKYHHKMGKSTSWTEAGDESGSWTKSDASTSWTEVGEESNVWTKKEAGTLWKEL